MRAQFLQVPFSSALGMSHPSLPPGSPLSLPFPKASVKKQFDISVCESGLWRRQGLGSEGLLSSATWRTRCFAALHVPILANSFLLTQQRLTEKQLLCTARGGVGKHQSNQMPAGWGALLPGGWVPAGRWLPLRGAGRAGWLLSDAPGNSPWEQHLLLVHIYLIFFPGALFADAPLFIFQHGAPFAGAGPGAEERCLCQWLTGLVLCVCAHCHLPQLLERTFLPSEHCHSPRPAPVQQCLSAHSVLQFTAGNSHGCQSFAGTCVS